MNTIQPAVGIDALAFSGPRSYIDMVDLAEARGVDPLKFTQGLGQLQMAVASPCEDTVTMAVQAARAALHNFDIDPADIGTLVVGTETGVDHAKPVAVYVHEHLGLAANCRTFETKHACYGAMAGLTASADWIVSGRARGRKALIIASDIARYGLGSAGEPTQGAGAVAIVVSERPRLFDLALGCVGDYTRQVMDFWRPLYSKVAFADGHYSIDCYLEALSASIADAKAQSTDPESLDSERMAACLYHVPFVKMARKAHLRHLQTDRPGVGDSAFAESYDARVAPWLTLNAQVGNIYTGSLFLALIDFLRRIDTGSEGSEASLFAYGSGCGACFLVGRVSDGAAAWASNLDPAAHLDRRHRLSVDAYEQMTVAAESADANDAPALDPEQWQLGDGLFYLGTRDHKRVYSA